MDGMQVSGVRRVMAWAMSALYLVAGLAHLRSPDTFVMITPDWVPYPRDVVLATGVCEIAGAVALVVGPLQKWAGAMLALYAVCVFPANVKHFVDDVPAGGIYLSPWYHIPRLAFQPVLVWWALYASGLVDWPFGAGRRTR